MKRLTALLLAAVLLLALVPFAGAAFTDESEIAEGNRKAVAFVQEKGVISGKFVSDGETYIFKADSYTGLDGGAYTAAVPLQIYVSIVSYDKKKKKYVKVKGDGELSESS